MNKKKSKKQYLNITVKNCLYVLLVIVIFLQMLLKINQSRDTFFSRGHSNNLPQLQKIYESSQYATKKNPQIMLDETFERYAGLAFLKGLNPILIVHDHPPLGRYIISLSYVLFDNPTTIIIPMLLISAIGMYLITILLIPNKFIALLPVALFVNEPIFLNKLNYVPLPEPIQLPFIIFAIYFFIRGNRSKKYVYWYIATSIMLGCVISIRFFITGVVLMVAMISVFLLKKQINKRFVFFISTLPLMIFVLLLTYTRTILAGYSPFQIFGIQKYILMYHQSKFILPFSFWELLLFNRWHTWWGDRAIASDMQWNFFWPTSAVISFLSGMHKLIRKKLFQKDELIIFVWLLLYTSVLSVGYTSTRYFLPVLPFLYIVSVHFCYSLLKKNTLKINK